MGLKAWAERQAFTALLKETGMSGFFAKLFSTDSIISRLVRAILLGLAGAAAAGQIHLPSWAVALIAALAGMIPAGQNNKSTGEAAPTSVTPHS